MDPESRFRALFASAYPALGRFARHRGLSDVDAEDLVAGTLEVAWRRIGQVPEDDPLPWLFAVAHNLLRNHYRAAHRRVAFMARLPIPEPSSAPNEPATLDATVLRVALSQLHDDDQEILRLVAWDGLSPSQAAVVLGCSSAAARTRLHRARQRLAAHLDIDHPLQRSGPRGQIQGGSTETTSTAEVTDA